MINLDERDILIKAIIDLLELNFNINIEPHLNKKEWSVRLIIFHNQLDIKLDLSFDLSKFTINKLPLTYDEICKELKQEYIKLLER